MTLSEELERLQRLRESGALTEEEFAAAKARVLAGAPAGGQTQGGFWSSLNLREGLKDVRLWAMALHLSLLLNISLPGTALLVPFLIWQFGKERFPELDAHGKNAVNFVVSYALYGIGLALVTMFLPLGLQFAMVLLLWYATCIVLVFYVAWQAKQGRVKSYPLAIRFLR